MGKSRASSDHFQAWYFTEATKVIMPAGKTIQFPLTLEVPFTKERNALVPLPFQKTRYQGKIKNIK